MIYKNVLCSSKLREIELWLLVLVMLMVIWQYWQLFGQDGNNIDSISRGNKKKLTIILKYSKSN